jgi:hypothetical protein
LSFRAEREILAGIRDFSQKSLEMTKPEFEMENKRAQRIAKSSRPWDAFSFTYFRFSFEANQNPVRRESQTASLYRFIFSRQ